MAKKKRVSRSSMSNAKDIGTKYFSEEPDEKIDTGITDFLLEESGEKGPQPDEIRVPPLIEREDARGSWYILATVFVILVVIITYYVNLDVVETVKNGEPEVMESPFEIILGDETTVVPTIEIAPVKPEDFTLETEGLRLVRDFRELENKRGDIINLCNENVRCTGFLKGYRNIGIRAGGTSYTMSMNAEGKIIDLQLSIQGKIDFVIDAKEEDMVALYNGFAMNDEEVVLLKLTKIIPPNVLFRAMTRAMPR